MEQKPVVNVKKERPFLETPSGQVVLMAATSIFTGFCMALGGNLFSKVAGTNKPFASREDNIIDLSSRTSKVA